MGDVIACMRLILLLLLVLIVALPSALILADPVGNSSLRPVSNFSVYEYSSFWRQVAVIGRADAGPITVGLSCITREYDCYPRHCDAPDVELVFTDSGITPAGEHITTTGFLDSTTPAGSSRTIHWDGKRSAGLIRSSLVSRYDIVQLGPMNAAFPEGFFSWAIVHAAHFDALGPV